MKGLASGVRQHKPSYHKGKFNDIMSFNFFNISIAIGMHAEEFNSKSV